MKKNLSDTVPTTGLQALEAVARLQSFTRAGAALGTSTAAVSQHIRALESRLGVRLLERTSRRVHTTEAGQRLLDEVTPALATLASSLQRLQADQHTPAGLLRINTSRLAARVFIEPVLDAFLARYPQIQLELFLDDTFADLVQGGFDAGIRVGDFIARDMVALPLDRGQRRVTVASPDYLARCGTPRRAADLLHHRCLRFRMPGSGRLEPWLQMVDGKPVKVEVPGTLIFTDDIWLNKATVAGHGLAQRLECGIRHELDTGLLVPVLARHAQPCAGFCIYYPERRLQAPKLQAFVSFLRESQGFPALPVADAARPSPAPPTRSATR